MCAGSSCRSYRWAAHIQVSEPSSRWKIATLDSPTTALAVLCRHPESRFQTTPNTTDQDSALRVEMSALEDQADDGKARELHWKPMSWLGSRDP